jgi:ATP-dependent DNA helicase RecG
MHLILNQHFIQEEIFRTVIWRRTEEVISGEVTREVSGEVGGEVSGEVSNEIIRIIKVLAGKAKRNELQVMLNLKSDDYFRVNYINQALEKGYIEITFPDSPNHPNQQYRLTKKGSDLKKKLKKTKRI